MAIITRILSGSLVSKESSIQRIGDPWIKLIETKSIKYNIDMKSIINFDEESVKKILPNYGITDAYVFGSFARGEATEMSDLDLLVTFPANLTLFQNSQLQEELEKMLSRRVDLISIKNTSKRLMNRIKEDLIPLVLSK